MAVFRLKVHYSWRKSAIKFLCVKTVSNKVVRDSLAYLRVGIGDKGFQGQRWKVKVIEAHLWWWPCGSTDTSYQIWWSISVCETGSWMNALFPFLVLFSGHTLSFYEWKVVLTVIISDATCASIGKSTWNIKVKRYNLCFQFRKVVQKH